MDMFTRYWSEFGCEQETEWNPSLKAFKTAWGKERYTTPENFISTWKAFDPLADTCGGENTPSFLFFNAVTHSFQVAQEMTYEQAADDILSILNARQGSLHYDKREFMSTMDQYARVCIF